MKPTPPYLRDLVLRLIAIETNGQGGVEPPASGAFLVCEKLRPQLATLMGKTGFCALLTRALTVANPENLWLRTIRVNANGTLEAMDEAVGLTEPAMVTEGGITLVVQLLALLVAFIGESMTLRMLREIWSDLPFSLIDLGDKP